MAWLDRHPPQHQQFRCPRRRAPSGVIGIHTAESFPDEVGPDDGAENVAEFIRTRGKYGSYHDICDSDSIINLIRNECVAYHIATFEINEHSIGISAATQAHKWNQLDPEWVDGTIRNMARSAARKAGWLQRHYGIDVPARWLSQSQAANRVPGFVRHSVADPERRQDPGATFPGNTFMAYYLEEKEGGIVATLDQEDYDNIAKAVWLHTVKHPWTDKQQPMQNLIRYTAARSEGLFWRVKTILDSMESGELEGVDTDALATRIANTVADVEAERMRE